MKGGYTCLCKEAIPTEGTYSFTALYEFTGSNGGFIGVARGDKNLNLSMSKKGAWGLRSDGTPWLDSETHYIYFPSGLVSGTIVAVIVNISEGWI